VIEDDLLEIVERGLTKIKFLPNQYSNIYKEMNNREVYKEYLSNYVDKIEIDPNRREFIIYFTQGIKATMSDFKKVSWSKN
jgi:hypothetical protein